ncbi:PrsW family intramembrane metalloprotease [Aegicerativicinus sediminis]|uniref:PrsW family intramembrane metalloprotease n=1 Tax=Aegicerativicinus sediminis TaxID=2893202 RepID=UPI001E529EE8|nr:PrsW family glutamic-type intramembrane protease [Aegicerativicinus sediminis]
MTLLLLAIAPVSIIMIFIYIMDLYEKEPLRLILSHFTLGALVSVMISTIMYLIFDWFVPLPNDESIIQLLVKAFVVVGFTEEFSKYIIVRFYSQRKFEFNEPYDGIMYAVLVSMGFAATENILYVLQGGMEVAIIRAFTAVPAHAIFAIMMGYFMGKAKFSKHRVFNNLLGLSLAIIFHGAYDFFLFIDFIPGFWIGAIVSLVIGIILSVRAIRKHQRNSLFKMDS